MYYGANVLHNIATFKIKFVKTTNREFVLDTLNYIKYINNIHQHLKNAILPKIKVDITV